MICTSEPVNSSLPIDPHHDLDPHQLPHHIAVIMDGNGRWARQRGLPRWVGHRRGVQALKLLLQTCQQLAIHRVTAYAFSTENWGRPASEVHCLMTLFEQVLQQEIQAMADSGVQIHFLGDRQGLPRSLQAVMQRATEITQQTDPRIHLQIALNYGGRGEILRACQRLAEQVSQGSLTVAEITEDHLTRHLDTAANPDPDLLIRTSGEMRLSNFLLWQLAYAEMYFTPTLWPDFDESHLIQALWAYQTRDRRFGGS